MPVPAPLAPATPAPRDVSPPDAAFVPRRGRVGHRCGSDDCGRSTARAVEETRARSSYRTKHVCQRRLRSPTAARSGSCACSKAPRVSGARRAAAAACSLWWRPKTKTARRPTPRGRRLRAPASPPPQPLDPGLAVRVSRVAPGVAPGPGSGLARARARFPRACSRARACSRRPRSVRRTTSCAHARPQRSFTSCPRTRPPKRNSSGSSLRALSPAHVSPRDRPWTRAPRPAGVFMWLPSPSTSSLALGARASTSASCSTASLSGLSAGVHTPGRQFMRSSAPSTSSLALGAHASPSASC
jgi:hypothetical protein